MTDEEKQFAIDLLRALDEGLGNNTQGLSNEHYESQIDSCRREIKRTVKKLIELGYKKCQNSL